jgi:hypothetical protein
VVFPDMTPSTDVKESSGLQASFDRCLCEEVIDLLFVFTAFVQILSFCIANWMLLLRVSALYGHNRTIFWGLTIFWILSYISAVTLMGLTAKDLHGQY